MAVEIQYCAFSATIETGGLLGKVEGLFTQVDALVVAGPKLQAAARQVPALCALVIADTDEQRESLQKLEGVRRDGHDSIYAWAYPPGRVPLRIVLAKSLDDVDNLLLRLSQQRGGLLPELPKLDSKFYGRQYLFDAFEKQRASLPEQAEGTCLLVVGGTGRGKSTWLAELARRVQEAGETAATHLRTPIFYFSNGSQEIATVRNELATRLIRKWGVEDPGPEKFTELLRDVGQKALERGNWEIVFLDAADQITAYDKTNHPLASLLPRVLPAGIQWLITTRYDNIWESCQSELNWQIQHIPWDDEDDRLVAQEFLTDLNGRLREKLPEDLINSIICRPEPKVFFTLRKNSQMLLQSEALEREQDSEGVTADLRSSPELWLRAAEETIKGMLNRLIRFLPEIPAPEIWRTLARICLAKSPLTLRQFLELGIHNKETRWSFEKVVFSPLASAFFKQHPGDANWETPIQFEHPGYSRLILDSSQTYLTQEDRLEIEAAYVLGCEAAMAKPASPVAEYARNQLVAHAIDGQNWRWLETNLTDLLFVERRIKAGEFVRLVTDYDAAIYSWPGQEEERLEEQSRRGRLRKYADDLVAYSKAKRLDPNCDLKLPTIKSVSILPPVDESEQVSFTPLEKLKAFRNFVATNSRALHSEESIESIAYNWRSNCPLQAAAEKLFVDGLPRGRNAWLKRRSPPKYNKRNSLTAVLEGHTEEVTSVAMSADGLWAVSGSKDKTVRVWNLTTCECEHVLLGHESSVNSVCISADGSKAASGCKKNLHVWNLQTGTCERKINHPGSYDKEELIAHWISPDGEKLISSYCHISHGDFRLWDLKAGQCERKFDYEGVDCFAIHRDGLRLDLIGAETWGDSRRLYSWDLTKGKLIRIYDLPRQHISHLSVCETNRQVMLFAGDPIYILDLDTGNTVERKLSSWGGYFQQSVDGTLAIASDRNRREIEIWDLQTTERVATVDRESEYRSWPTSDLQNACMTPDGSQLLSIGTLSSLRLWNLMQTAREAPSEHRKDHGVSVIRPSKDGSRLIFQYGRSSWFMLLCNEKGASIIETHADRIESVGITPNSRYCITGSEDGTVCIWDLVPGWIRWFWYLFFGKAEAYCRKKYTFKVKAKNLNVGFSSDGKLAFCVGDAGNESAAICVWNARTGRPVCQATPENRYFPPRSVVLSAEFNELLFHRAFGLCKFNICTLEMRDVVGLPKPELHCSLSLAPRGDFIAAGTFSGDVDIYNLSSSQFERRLTGGHSRINCVCVTPDNRFVVALTDTSTAHIWNLQSGVHEQIQNFEGEPNDVSTFMQSNSQPSISVVADGNFKVYEVKSRPKLPSEM